MNTGTRLREAREARGISIEELARVTRVQPRILQAFENNDAHAIPPRPYGRGFLRSYATHVGLDPEDTVRDFFGQFASTVERHDEQTTVLKWQPYVRGLTAAATWAIAIAVIVVAGRALLSREGEPEAAATTGTSVPVAASTTGTAPQPPPSAPPPPPREAVVTLDAHGTSWVTATVDGTRTIYRNLQAGERETLRGQEIVLRVGDAAAVKWQVNGGAASIMGEPGQVRDARIDLQGVR
jgi:transcriptional regulator with XRE-family HTH domain